MNDDSVLAMSGSRSKLRRRTLSAALGFAVMLTAVMVTTAASQANELWHCSPDPQSTAIRACTRIKNAPTSGVQVRDHQFGEITTLYNGNSVQLGNWAWDTSGLCGIHGDPYVWGIDWFRPTGNGGFRKHSATIGDWYLATGTVPQWNWFTDYKGQVPT
jgi:hypothetical protein